MKFEEMISKLNEFDEIVRNYNESNGSNNERLEELDEIIENLEHFNFNVLRKEDLNQLIELLEKISGKLNHVGTALDFREKADELQEKVNKKLEEIREFSNSFEVVMREIIELNPDVNLAFVKGDEKKIYSSVSKDKLKLPEGVDIDVLDIKKAPKNAIKVNEVKKDGFFKNVGNLASCLVGQADKKISNWWYNDESKVLFGKEKRGDVRYKRVTERRKDRYENLGSHFLKNAIYTGVSSIIFTALIATGFTIGGPLPVIIASVTGVMGVTGIAKCVGDLVRKRGKKGPKPVIRNKEILEGTWVENIKKALSKFGLGKNSAKKSKNNNKTVKTTSVPSIESEVKKSTDNKENQQIMEFVNNFVKAVNEKKQEEAKFYYDQLMRVCGGEVEKFVPKDVINAYQELKSSTTENAEKTETSDKEERKNLYIEACLKKMREFNLENTKESVEYANSNILSLFAKVEDVMKNSTLYKSSYDEYLEFKSDVEFRQKVFAFIYMMLNDYKASELTYDMYRMISSDFIKLRDDKEHPGLFSEIIKNDKKFLAKYKSFLIRSRQFILKDRVDALDIANIYSEGDYNKAEMVTRMAGGYDNRRSGNLPGIEKGLEGYDDSLAKLEELRSMRETIMSDYKMMCTLIVGNDSTVHANYTDHLGNEKVFTLETKDSDKITQAEFEALCREELSKKLLVPTNKIGLKVVRDRFSFEEATVSKGARK